LKRLAPAIGEGDLSQDVKFRGSDEAKELEEALNVIIGGLRRKVSDVKQDSQKVLELTGEIIRIGQSEPLPVKLVEVTKQVEATLGSLNEKLTGFKVTAPVKNERETR
jgi:methyl-accepting chemotaxis protein